MSTADLTTLNGQLGTINGQLQQKKDSKAQAQKDYDQAESVFNQAQAKEAAKAKNSGGSGSAETSAASAATEASLIDRLRAAMAAAQQKMKNLDSEIQKLEQEQSAKRDEITKAEDQAKAEEANQVQSEKTAAQKQQEAADKAYDEKYKEAQKKTADGKDDTNLGDLENKYFSLIDKADANGKKDGKITEDEYNTFFSSVMDDAEKGGLNTEVPKTSSVSTASGDGTLSPDAQFLLDKAADLSSGKKPEDLDGWAKLTPQEQETVKRTAANYSEKAAEMGGAKPAAEKKAGDTKPTVESNKQEIEENKQKIKDNTDELKKLRDEVEKLRDARKAAASKGSDNTGGIEKAGGSNGGNGGNNGGGNQVASGGSSSGGGLFGGIGNLLGNIIKLPFSILGGAVNGVGNALSGSGTSSASSSGSSGTKTASGSSLSDTSVSSGSETSKTSSVGSTGLERWFGSVAETCTLGTVDYNGDGNKGLFQSLGATTYDTVMLPIDSTKEFCTSIWNRAKA